MNGIDLAMLEFARAVQNGLREEFAVSFGDVGGDIGHSGEVPSLQEAHRSGADPTAHVAAIGAFLRLSAAGLFPSPADAGEFNRRQAALTGFAHANGWKLAPNGAGYLALGDVTLRLSVTGCGARLGFETSAADDAEIHTDHKGDVTVTGSFERVAAGSDIDDAIAGWNRTLDEPKSLGM